MKKVFEIQEGDTLIQTAWLSGAMYKKGTGCVELTFSSYLKPYMLKLSSMFTQYKLSNILSMKSKYSPRIYEILKCNEFKKQGFIEIEVEGLRKLIKADEVYPKYNDFKRYVIERTQKELKKLSDLSFEFEEIKTGRKVTSLKFYIHSNKSKGAKEPPLLPIDDEVAATVELEEDSAIKRIMAIMIGHKITALEAKKIYDSSQGNIDIINKVYQDKKDKSATGIVGLMISLVKPGVYIEPKKNYGKDNFNNYEQRPFDPTLEAKLLGWENEINETTGEEYQQSIVNIE
jgi:plasmid replication initiation protein